MRNNLDGDVTKSYRMNTQFMFEILNVFCLGWHLAVSHKYNSNSLAAIPHINKYNAAGNSKKVAHPWSRPHYHVQMLCTNKFRLYLYNREVFTARKVGLKLKVQKSNRCLV